MQSTFGSFSTCSMNWNSLRPFAAILIAYGTYVFLGGGLMRPEGPKCEIGTNWKTKGEAKGIKKEN